MSKQMLIDATHEEETRVVVLEDGRLDEFDVDTSTKKQIKGNIYLAKVVRVEPSLQAAFVDYGGNKHGFLPFGEIHPDYYQIPVADKEALKAQLKEEAQAEATENDEEISEANEEKETVSSSDTDEVIRHRSSFLRRYKIQEVIRQGQVMLVQVMKEERGNKGAAITTYLSLAGRFSVLMPNNNRGGGVSRKINNAKERKELREIVEKLPIPDGMSVIIRTAGQGKTKSEIKRDFDYLMKTWMQIRETTLKSIAPKLIHEEGNIIKRSLRDVLTADTDEIWIEGEEIFKNVRSFMKTLMPTQVKKVKQYKGSVPLFQEYRVEDQLEAIHSNIVQLRSGGYLVIDQTEALVAVDVNSGRAIREHNIEETALRTNLETCDELARQLRLRDLAGLIVIDFIDMDEPRNNAAVERRLKEALKRDRARIQVGRMSGFGLMEMSRQRLHSSFLESSYHVCPYCGGKGLIRSTESAAMHVLHQLTEIAEKNQKGGTLVMTVPPETASYVLNMKRETLKEIETRFGLQIQILADSSLLKPSDFRMERIRENGVRVAVNMPQPVSHKQDKNSERAKSIDEIVQAAAQADEEGGNKGRHGRHRRRDWKQKQKQFAENQAEANEQHQEAEKPLEASAEEKPNFTIVEQASLTETQEKPSKKGHFHNRKNHQKDGAVPAVREEHVPAPKAEQVPMVAEDHPAPVPMGDSEKPKKGGWWNRLMG